MQNCWLSLAILSRVFADMKSYIRTIVFFPLFLLVYTLVATVDKETTKGKEFFPFFQWSLFTYIPSPAYANELWVTGFDGNDLPEPLFIFELKDQFRLAARNSPTVFKLLDRIALAYQDEDNETLARLISLLEQNYLKDNPDTDYIIVGVVFEPIERWRTKEIDKYWVIYDSRTD